MRSAQRCLPMANPYGGAAGLCAFHAVTAAWCCVWLLAYTIWRMGGAVSTG